MPRGTNPKSLANLEATKIKKGEVRNPLGINRKRPYTDRMFAHSEELLRLTEAGEKTRKRLNLPNDATWADASIRELNLKASKGDIAAIKEMADRIEGKPPERIEISGPERKEITIRVKYEKQK